MAASASSKSTHPVISTLTSLTALAFKPSVTGFLSLNKALFRLNRTRLCDALKAAGAPEKSYVLIKGSDEVCRDDTDHEPVFRQNSHFLWAFGANISDCLGLISVDDGSATLLVPKLDPSFAIWMGRIKTPEDFVDEYGVEKVAFTSELPALLAAASPAKLFLSEGVNSDSGAQWRSPVFEGKDALVAAGVVDTELLYPTMAELRTVKTEHELEVMRFVNGAASDAHCVMMRAAAPGMREDALEAVFKFWMQSTVGARLHAYTYICGSGPNAATLHYGHSGAPNDRITQDGDIMLCDLGHELHGYASDITTTFPVNGSFSEDQKVIYSAVLAALEAVEAAMRPGVHWPEMQTLAYRHILSVLKAGGLLTGDVDDMLAVNLGSVFMPHGLGHFLGIDTHDVGGYLGDATPRDSRAGYRALRTSRTLREGNVITVEPGCYFVDHLLDEALANKEHSVFIIPEVLARFRGSGGVRLEDNVIVTSSGIENMTYVPRSIDDVEAMCACKVTDRDGFSKRFQS